MLGGLNVIVKIDEAKVERRKYNIGRIIKGQRCSVLLSESIAKCLLCLLRIAQAALFSTSYIVELLAVQLFIPIPGRGI